MFCSSPPCVIHWITWCSFSLKTCAVTSARSYAVCRLCSMRRSISVFTLTFLVPKANPPLALRVRCVCAKLLLTLWAITKAVVSFMLPWLGQLGYIMLWGALFMVKYVSGSSSGTLEQVLKWRLVVSAVASDVRLLVVLLELLFIFGRV